MHWLRGPKAAAIVEMFGELTVPHFTWDVFAKEWTEHDVQCCQAGLQNARFKRFGSDDLQMDFELLVLADVLRKSAVDTDDCWRFLTCEERTRAHSKHLALCPFRLHPLGRQQERQILRACHRVTRTVCVVSPIVS